MEEKSFNNEGNNTIINCDKNDKIKDEINLSFVGQANKLDKDNNNLNLKNDKDNKGNTKKVEEIISKNIICPICKEKALIYIKDFKIGIYGCKKYHRTNKILLSKYEESQKINLSKIICNICNKNFIEINNKFFICNICNKNICSKCKLIHNKEHFLINYEDKNYICKKHNKIFNKYCKKCFKDICGKCSNEHINHDIIEYKDILPDKLELKEIIEELESIVNVYKYKINSMKKILDRMLNILEIYCKLSHNIMENFNIKRKNYFNIQNFNYLKDNIKNTIDDIRCSIIKDKVYEFSCINFYNDKGEKYIGKVINGLKEGKGVLYYNKTNQKDIKRYEGGFKKDKFEGIGIMTWNSGMNYVGDFKNGLKEGKGQLFWNNYYKFKEDLNIDKREGKGILYYYIGNRYEGDYKNDKREGKGILYYYNNDRYEGEFKNDKREGKGIYTFENGDRYEGDYKNDKREGKGIMYFKDGDIYEGDYKNDKKEGKGIMYYKDGDIYEGDYKNDKKEGKGIYYYKNGDRYEGYWKNNRIEGGKGIMHYRNGEIQNM